jgi:CHRD domain
MRRYGLTAVAAAAVVAFSANYACAQEFTAYLTGFNEIGEITGPYQNGDGFVYTGAILSDGTATAKFYLDKNAQTINYTLTYSNVGTTPPLTGTVTQAHIHFGKSRNSGGILVFLCTNLGNGPAGTPTCPGPNSGTVTGTLTAASVVAIPSENVNANDFAALTGALASNTAYVNIHTTGLPGGEIRGQCHSERQEGQGQR